jgi:hypothetical protein
MNNINSHEYNIIDSNPFESYYNKLVRIQVRGDARSVNGEVIAINGNYLTLQHKDGRTSLIKLSQISVITEIPKAKVV